jgi:hypothetical protein
MTIDEFDKIEESSRHDLFEKATMARKHIQTVFEKTPIPEKITEK